MALVYKYADAIVKNFANASVMAILIVISTYSFQVRVETALLRGGSLPCRLAAAPPPLRCQTSARGLATASLPLACRLQLQTTLHSWLGIIIVLTTTYCYMNIALRLPPPTPTPTELENACLLEGGESGGETDHK